MGSEVTVIVPRAHAESALELTQSIFHHWETTLSRFDPASELSRLNASQGAPFLASPLLLKVTAAALQAAEATDGDFDPTLLPRHVALGYDRTFTSLPASGPPVALTPERSGRWREILVQRDRGVILLPPGVALDFGGIAKGMAVDTAVAELKARDWLPTLVNAGGDLAVAGVPQDQDSWSLAVDHVPGATVPLARGALATSAVTKRSWRRGDTLLHHLLDPRRGLPADGDILAATVAAASCMQAEVAAKTALLRGPEAGARFLLRHGLSGLLHHRDGRLIFVGDFVLARGETS
jgi:thiamine biosynthesis lipoprotein